MSKYITHLFLFTIILTANACSHSPTTGEQMVLEGSNAKDLGEKWTDGSNLNKKGTKKIVHGEAMIEKGNKLIDKGNTEIHEGQSMNKKGNKIMHKSENTFHEEYPEKNIEK